MATGSPCMTQKKEPQASSGVLAVLFFLYKNVNVELAMATLLNVDRVVYLKLLPDTFCYAIL